MELLPVEQSVPAFKEDEHPFDAQEANDAHHDDALQETWSGEKFFVVLACR